MGLQRSTQQNVRGEAESAGMTLEDLIGDLLTFFPSRLEVLLPLRDGMLGVNRSRKLILTGWPLALRRGAMLVDICYWSVLGDG